MLQCTVMLLEGGSMNKMKLLQHLQPSLLTLFAFLVILILSYCSAETCNILQGDEPPVNAPALLMARGRLSPFP